MSEPIEWPMSPPTDAPSSDLPPPPDGGRAVAGPLARAGDLALDIVLMACTFGFGWVGWWIIAWADGQTPSKVLLHLHVVRADDGQLASFGRMAVREAVGKGIPGAFTLAVIHFGHLWLLVIAANYFAICVGFALGDPRRRTLWDRLAGTVVVEGDPPPIVPPLPPALFTAPVEADTAPL